MASAYISMNQPWVNVPSLLNLPPTSLLHPTPLGCHKALALSSLCSTAKSHQLQSKGLSRVFSNTTVQKHQLFGAQLSSQSNMTTGKTKVLTRRTFVGKVMPLLSRLVNFPSKE